MRPLDLAREKAKIQADLERAIEQLRAAAAIRVRAAEIICTGAPLSALEEPLRQPPGNTAHSGGRSVPGRGGKKARKAGKRARVSLQQRVEQVVKGWPEGELFTLTEVMEHLGNEELRRSDVRNAIARLPKEISRVWKKGNPREPATYERTPLSDDPNAFDALSGRYKTPDQLAAERESREVGV